MNKKIYILISLLIITILIKFFSVNPFNPPFFKYFSHFASSGIDLKMAADRGNLETVNSIINNHEIMLSISPWELGMALAFAAAQTDSKESKNNQKLTDTFYNIILAILDSKFPIDNDYLGQILVYAVYHHNLNIVKAILNNPYATYIDKSFKVAIFFQSYMGNSSAMPSSFLQKALEHAVKNNNKEIVAELLHNPVLKNRFPKELEKNAFALIAK